MRSLQGRRTLDFRALAFAIGLLLTPVLLSAQSSGSATLRGLLRQAEVNYPLLKAKAATVQAAQKSITASQSTLIPVVMAAYQANYATNNNLVGMSFAQFVPPISGPPSAANSSTCYYGSTATLWMNWQPYTFGQREAQVNLATAGLQVAEADNVNEVFQQKIKVVNAYLNVLTAQELINVSKENLLRTQANLAKATALVQSGIRPAVDTALYRAEEARATVDLLNAQNTQRQAAITLAQLVASDTTLQCADSSFILSTPILPSGLDSVRHPFLSLASSSIGLSVARRNVFAKSMMPMLDVWAATFARGSGVPTPQKVDPIDGLNFQRYNYGVGLQISVPVLQFLRVGPQIDAEEYTTQSLQERYNDVSLQLRKQNEIADTALRNAIAITKESPLYYESAAFSYRAMFSRYQSGLATFADLQQAQYSLVKAETDNKLAFMNAWKALLNKASIAGDINVFLNQAN